MADPPKLPKNAPQDLKDFVACIRDEVTLDPANADWIPKPKKVPKDLAPSATVKPGAAANSADVTIGYAGGLIGITLPVSVSGGHLNVDTSTLDSFEDLVKPIDDWVKQLNDQLDQSGKALEGLTVKDGKVVLKKRKVVVGQPSTAPPSPPASSAPQVKKASEPKSGEPESGDSKNPGGCLLGILVGLLLTGVLGAGAFFVLRGDDGGQNVTADLASTVPNLATTAAAPEPTPTTLPRSTVTSSTGPAVVEVTTTVPRIACGDLAAQPSGLLAPRGVESGSWWDDPRLLERCDEPVDGRYAPLPLDLTSRLFPALVLPGGGVGVNHTKSVADAVTGRPGLSEALLAAYVAAYRGSAQGTMRVASQCGQDLSTGEAPLVSGGVTTLEQPLLHYGPCEVVTVSAGLSGDAFWVPPTLFGDAGSYVVGPDQPSPGMPDLAKWDALIQYVGSLDEDEHPVLDVFGLLAGGPIEPRCTSFVASDSDALIADAQNPCAASGSSRFVFRGVPPTGSPITPLFTSGVFANPAGAFGPDATSFGQADSWDALFRHSIFPCGFGHVAYTACPAQDTGDPVAAFVALALELPDALALAPGDDAPTMTVTSADTGHSWTLQAVEGQWTLLADQATAARAIIRNATLVFVIPQSEAGASGASYRITTGSDTVAGAITVDGALHTPTGAAAPTTGEVEDLDSFLAQLSASISAGDGGFAVDRLDPHVIEQFGAEACRAKYVQPSPGFEVVALETLDTQPWDWPLPDGTSVSIPAVVYLNGRITQGGQTGDAELHLTIIDGQYRWFTYCT